MTQSALIVGASGGIGRTIATRLAASGWSILAHGRDAGRLERTEKAVRDAGARYAAFTAELTAMDQVKALADWAARPGKLDAVIWAAAGGRSVDSGPEAVAEWERTLQSSLWAPMTLTAHTLASVRAAAGAYLFVCGPAAKIGMARMAGHCAVRHGLEGFAKALFEEVREDGVKVTVLHPGFVNTPLTQSEKLNAERMIQPDDIAALVTTALDLPPSACMTELTVRPQRSPYA